MKHLIMLTLCLFYGVSSTIYSAHVQREEEFHQSSQPEEHEPEVEHRYVAKTWGSWAKSLWLRERPEQTEIREQKETFAQLTKNHEQALQEQALVWSDASAIADQRNDATNSVPYLRVQQRLLKEYQKKLTDFLDDVTDQELRKQLNDRIKQVEQTRRTLKGNERRATPLTTFSVQQQKSLIIFAYDVGLKDFDADQLADISPESFLKVAKPFLSDAEVKILEKSINEKMGAGGFKDLGKKLLTKIINNVRDPLSAKQKQALKALLLQTYRKALHEIIVGGVRIARGEEVEVVLAEFIGNIFKSLINGCKILLAPLKERIGNTSLGLWYQKEVMIDDFSKEYLRYVSRESGVADYMKDLWSQLDQKMTIDDQEINKFTLDDRIDIIGRIRNDLVIVQATSQGSEQKNIIKLDEQLLEFMKNPMFKPGTRQGWFLGSASTISSMASSTINSVMSGVASVLSLS